MLFLYLGIDKKKNYNIMIYNKNIRMTSWKRMESSYFKKESMFPILRN
jgi:hypothetical protein